MDMSPKIMSYFFGELLFPVVNETVSNGCVDENTQTVNAEPRDQFPVTVVHDQPDKTVPFSDGSTEIAKSSSAARWIPRLQRQQIQLEGDDDDIQVVCEIPVDKPGNPDDDYEPEVVWEQPNEPSPPADDSFEPEIVYENLIENVREVDNGDDIIFEKEFVPIDEAEADYSEED